MADLLAIAKSCSGISVSKLVCTNGLYDFGSYYWPNCSGADCAIEKSNGVMRFLASKNKNRVEDLVNRRKEIVADVELLKLKFPLVNE